jgi:drug/metabolite transporter (DMT)-like permease
MFKYYEKDAWFGCLVFKYYKKDAWFEFSLLHINFIQSLVYTSPARSSSLGSLPIPTVMCPILEAVFDRRDTSICNAPQMWLAAVLSLSGVAVLEFYGPSDEDDADQISNEALGDGLAVLSAAFMSACFYTTERMMRDCTNQVLPITAVQVLVSAVTSTIWCTIDHWFGASWTESYGLPSSLFTQNMLPATLAIAWTGLIATDLNFLLETTALGTVSSSEAAVILATEPLWVSLFTFLFIHESFNAEDCVGGILIIAACVVIAWKSESPVNRVGILYF